MARRRTLTLTTEQLAELCRRRDHGPRPSVRERCAALPRIADGATPTRVARRGMLKPHAPDTGYGWLPRYEADGRADVLAHRRAREVALTGARS